MEITLKLDDETLKLNLTTNSYLQNGGLALLLTEEGLPFTTVSVNLPNSYYLPENVFFVKHWGENEKIVAQLVEQKIIQKVENIPPASSEFISEIYAYKLTEDFENK